MAKKCERDCFNCKFDDCIIETVTKEEREEQNWRDREYISYGFVLKQRPARAKHRGRR